jgi:tRNA(Arg) A34 adenosine deaminase TadA
MRIKDMIKVAGELAKSGSAKRHYWIAAIGVRKDGAIVMSRNETTRIPNPEGHAEKRLTKKLGMDAQLVLVVRINRDGSMQLAKPCIRCEGALRAYRVKKVYYTTPNGIDSW